jgi:hypothetical protein
MMQSFHCCQQNLVTFSHGNTGEYEKFVASECRKEVPQYLIYTEGKIITTTTTTIMMMMITTTTTTTSFVFIVTEQVSSAVTGLTRIRETRDLSLGCHVGFLTEVFLSPSK